MEGPQGNFEERQSQLWRVKGKEVYEIEGRFMVPKDSNVKGHW